MTTTVNILRDGRDLVAGFSDGPAGLTAFGPVGHAGRVWVRCPAGDLMPLRGAIDWLQDEGYAVAGVSDHFARQLGLMG